MIFHPSAMLLCWLMGLVAAQFCNYWGLPPLAAPLLLKAGVMRRWLAFLSKTKWLLVMLWLILAFNMPGEAVLDSGWLPTYEGIAEANLHALRLVAMLLGVAWLFQALGRDGLVEALWLLLDPFRRRGMDVERLAVRLSLVLELVQSPLPKGAWRQMLGGEGVMALPVGDRISLCVRAWRTMDTGMVGLWGLLMLAWVRL